MQDAQSKLRIIRSIIHKKETSVSKDARRRVLCITACGLPQLRIEFVPKLWFEHSKHKAFRYTAILHIHAYDPMIDLILC